MKALNYDLVCVGVIVVILLGLISPSVASRFVEGLFPKA